MSRFNLDFIQTIIRLRKQLHNIPEHSMCEYKTKEILISFLREKTNFEIIDCGKWFYAAYRIKTETRTICIRSDIDAVTDADGISRHLCGHDGHAAILAGLALYITEQKPANNIILLFQPGEESGEGAAVCTELFVREKIDAIYGFHNIPGYPVGKLLFREGTFACASTGLEISFKGETAHAAYPDKGRNPGVAIAEMIMLIDEYAQKVHRGIVLSTVIGIEAGSKSYGVSASEGKLRVTVRAEYFEEFNEFLVYIQQTSGKISEKYGLTLELKEIEKFPATENNISAVRRIYGIAEENNMDYEMLKVPFRWSEDFGWYLMQKEGAFFGIGSGEDCLELHSKEYEFRDEVIEPALEFYSYLAQKG